MRPTTAVAIMAKAPLAGQVKTRLCPPLSAEEAAALYRCFLLDKIDQTRRLAGASPAVAYAPAEARALFEGLAPDLILVPQEGPDLGARLANVVETLLARGYAGVLAVDSDTPSLPTDYLQRAVDLVASPRADVVLGPSEDGGYYLIGLRAPRRALFEDMPWSTPGVLPETLRRAEAAGLATVSLPTWFDVDTYRDLERLEASLADADGSCAPNTRRFLSGRAA